MLAGLKDFPIAWMTRKVHPCSKITKNFDLCMSCALKYVNICLMFLQLTLNLKISWFDSVSVGLYIIIMCM